MGEGIEAAEQALKKEMNLPAASRGVSIWNKNLFNRRKRRGINPETHPP